MSGVGADTRPQYRAPGAALPMGSLGGPGRPGQVADVAGQAMLADVYPHVAVPVVIELAADIVVGVHGGLLCSAGLAGMLWPPMDRLPGGRGGHQT
jgi:hypothetical protein